MGDYIDRQAAIDVTLEDGAYGYISTSELWELPAADVVPMEVYKQVAWERDIATAQLNELGYALGEKIVTCMHCKYVMEPKEDIRRPRCLLHDCTEVECNGYCKWGTFKEV